MDNKKAQEYIFCNYTAFTRKTCFQLIFVSAALCCLLAFVLRNKIYLFLSISMACMIVGWAVYLLFSKKRELPEYKFFSEGIILAYMSLQFLYAGYVVLCNEEKPIIFLLLMLVLIGCSFGFLQVAKRRMQKGVKKYSKVWDFITVPVVILGYFCAKAFSPRLEYEFAIKIAIGIVFFCSLIMGCCCTTKFLKVTLIRKLHITKP